MRTALRPRPWLVRLTITSRRLAGGAARRRGAPVSARGPVGSLPPTLRALVISGVLAAWMAKLVMPLLGRVAESWSTRRRRAGGPTDVRIVQLRSDQVRAVGEVLSQSHAEYPAFRGTLPDAKRRRRALCRMFTGSPGCRALRLSMRPKRPTGASSGRRTGFRLTVSVEPLRQLREPDRSSPYCSLYRGRSRPSCDGMNAVRLHSSDCDWYLETMVSRRPPSDVVSVPGCSRRCSSWLTASASTATSAPPAARTSPTTSAMASRSKTTPCRWFRAGRPCGHAPTPGGWALQEQRQPRRPRRSLLEADSTLRRRVSFDVIAVALRRGSCQLRKLAEALGIDGARLGGENR